MFGKHLLHYTQTLRQCVQVITRASPHQVVVSHSVIIVTNHEYV